MSVIKDALRHPVLIAYLSGANNYSFIHFRNGEQVLVSKSLRFLEKHLPKFVRIHKTVLINPVCIVDLLAPSHHKAAGAVVLEGGATLPVSRRRWAYFVRDWQEFNQPASEASATGTYHRAQLSVKLISDDLVKCLLMQQLVAEQWPYAHLQVVANSGVIPTLLASLSETEQPALILLDARIDTATRLNTLRELKENPNLRRLPVVLLIAPESNADRSGYALRANSAVVVPSDNAQFINIMQQVCSYWLTLAALPLPASPSVAQNENPAWGSVTVSHQYVRNA